VRVFRIYWNLQNRNCVVVTMATASIGRLFRRGSRAMIVRRSINRKRFGPTSTLHVTKQKLALPLAQVI
jgi:hypothetical protein